jgi:hypothetical protein
MPDQLIYLQLFQQLFGSGTGWTHATLLASLFLVLIFRPERIRSRTLFYVACWCFALSVLVAPTLTALFSVTGWNPFAGPSGPGVFGGPGGSPLVTMVAYLSGPVLFGLSVLFGLLALVPGPRQDSPFQPPRHPLE